MGLGTSQVDKYLELLNYSKLKRKNLKESNEYLQVVERNINKFSTKELTVMRTELTALVETYKLSSIVTSMISTLVAIVVVIITAMKELVLIDKSDFIEKNVMYVVIVSACSIVFFPTILFLGRYIKKYSMLTQVLGLVDNLIDERKKIDELIGEAYKENLKYLKEDSPIT